MYNNNDEEDKGYRLSNIARKRIIGASRFAKDILFLTIKAIFAFLGPTIIIFMIGMLGYFVLFEFEGTEKRYTPKYENETILEENRNLQITKLDMMNPENKTINDFYKYFAGQGYVQIHEKGNDEIELIRIDDERAVKDFYNREEEFTLNENILYVLDSRLYENWKYPEQFVKPVYFDEGELELRDLTDKEGIVQSNSVKRYITTGRPIPIGGGRQKYDGFNKEGFEITESVRDYGLATVLKYLEGIRNLTVEGTYVMEDYWDGEKVAQRSINEPFIVQLAGFTPEQIHVIEKAITFMGEISYEYEDLKSVMQQPLNAGSSTNEGEPVEMYEFDTYEEVVGYTDGGEAIIISHPLYKYRSEDSAIIEELPTVVNTETNDKGDKYLRDYIWNFEAYIPEDVLTDFDFSDRIDYDSSVFDMDEAINGDYGMEIGSNIKGRNVRNSLKFKDWFFQYGEEFGVDPYLLIAIASQESGGNPNINADGLMQITSGHRDITANDINGYPVNFTITNRRDPESSIKYAAMRMRNIIDKYDGNVYKAVQEYNFGPGTMLEVKKASGAAWDSEFGWMIFREAGRRKVAPQGLDGQPKSSASYGCVAFPEGTLRNVKGNLFGDSCYVENVLRYYAGNDVEALEGSSFWDKLKGFAGSLISKFSEFLTIKGEREDPVVVKNYISHKRADEPETIIKMINAYDNTVLFSESSGEDLVNTRISLFSEGFLDYMGGGSYLSMDELLEAAPNPDGYTPPIVIPPGRISSEFGPRVRPNGQASSNHKGIDIAVPIGTPLYAVADGMVLEARYSGNAGNKVVIQHDNGALSVYMHMNAFAVIEGERVTQRQPIGQTGNTGNSTGPHLHYEFHINGVPINPKPIIVGSR